MIDDQIFDGSDTPLDEVEEVFKWLQERIDNFVEGGFSGDRAFIPQLEVLIAVMFHLSERFDNTVTSREKATEWKIATLRFFDSESQEQGDEKAVVKWRLNIHANFDRLIDCLFCS